jgi:hypothetical protein
MEPGVSTGRRAALLHCRQCREAAGIIRSPGCSADCLSYSQCCIAGSFHFRPEIEVGVVLEWYAHQVADRILRQLRQFRGTQCRMRRSCRKHHGDQTGNDARTIILICIILSVKQDFTIMNPGRRPLGGVDGARAGFSEFTLAGKDAGPTGEAGRGGCGRLAGASPGCGV